MKQVLLATIPGVLVLTWFFGPSTIINIIFGSALALAFEAWALWLRGKDYKTPLRDHSVIVTATLLCIALPPYAPWWLIAVGIGVSVLLGKHVFGGLGYNPFNPAMVGYVVLLISFPLQMSSWTEPRGIGEVPGIVDAFTALFAASSYDAVTAATPLDLFRQNSGMLFDDLMQSKAELTGPIAGLGWDWVNLAFLRVVSGYSDSAFLPGMRRLACWPLSRSVRHWVTMRAALRVVVPCYSTCLVAPPCSVHFS